MDFLPQTHVEEGTRAAILAHAREAFEAKLPVEACGFIAAKNGKQKAVRSPNRSTTPAHHFRTCPKVWREVEDDGWQIVAVYHSHVSRPPLASPDDKGWSEKSGLPFLIVGMPSGSFGHYIPTGAKLGLEGRPFVFGVWDCLSLWQDYYQQELGITIPSFDYDEDWWQAKEGRPPQDLYMQHYREGGFRLVDNLQKHDVLLIPISPSKVANHAAIYIGDGQILHHLSGRLSKREPYLDGVGYARRVRAIVRHETL